MTEKRDSNFQIFASNIARRITIALPALAKALSEEKNALVQKKLASILQAKGWQGKTDTTDQSTGDSVTIQ